MLVDQINEYMERMTPEITHISLWAVADGPEMEDDELESFVLGLANATGISDIIRAQVTEENEYDDLLKEFVTFSVRPFYLPFEEDDGWFEPVPEGRFTMFEFWLAFGGGLILLVMFAVLLVALARRAKKAREEEEEYEIIPGYGPVPIGMGGEMDAFAMALSGKAVADEIGGDETSLEVKEENLKKQIKIFVDQNPEIAAQLIKTLLKGDEANG
jgi:flagellar M-ring protein FliF